MDLNNKILSVLDKLKEEWDITPQNDYSIEEDIYRHLRKAREADINYINWLYDISLDDYELSRILEILKEESFIDNYSFPSDFVGETFLRIIFAVDFETKYGKIKNKKKLNKEQSNKIESFKAENKNNKLITKIGDEFYFQDNLIDFGKDTQYRDIFDIIYSNCIQTNFISYEKINKELIIREWKDISQKKISKRILNAITNGVFRFAKIGNKKFENKLPNGKKILETIRGKGIQFNNY